MEKTEQIAYASCFFAVNSFLKTTGRTGWTLYIPMFVMLAVTFTALIQKTIALVSNIAGGQATFLVDGLQFIVAILLMVLPVVFKNTASAISTSAASSWFAEPNSGQILLYPPRVSK